MWMLSDEATIVARISPIGNDLKVANCRVKRTACH